MKTSKDRSILNIKISSTPREGLIELVFDSLKKKKEFFIVTPNPEIIVTAQNDKLLQDIINSSDIALPDGAGLLLAEMVLGIPKIERIPGRSFMLDLVAVANTQKLKLFFLGASASHNKAFISKLKEKYPSIKVMGESGPFVNNHGKAIDEKQIDIENQSIKNINSFKPDILFIAFGAPKQEKWFQLNRNKLNVGGAMVVGGSIDSYISNTLPPKFFEELGLEWLWRLFIEPKRFARIFNATIVFPMLVIVAKARSLLK